MPPRALIALDSFDPNRVVATIDEIRLANPQRYEMEQLSHICHADLDEGMVAGVLNVPEDPWWARGHIPGRPLMPGVIMLEAAAQLCSFFVRRVYDSEEYGERFFGFAALDDVKFRGMILPGQQLILLGKKAEVRPRRAVFDTQGWVEGKLAFQAKITGMWV